MAKSPKNTENKKGFEEAPQQPLSGEPLGGSVSDWAGEISREAGGNGTASAKSGDVPAKKKKSPKLPPKRSKEAGKSARGTVIGGAASPKERAATGLNPIAGLDVSLEEAERLLGKTGKSADKFTEPKQIFNETVSPNKQGASAFESGVTATVASLSKLIEGGDPNLMKEWVPHRPARPVKSDGGIELKMVTDFESSGDQPTAIADLVEGLGEMSSLPPVGRQAIATPDTIPGEAEPVGLKPPVANAEADETPTRSGHDSHDQSRASPQGGGGIPEQTQVLLGVTGSGKTFTMAKVIEATQRPAIILAPNKTLAAQLYGEMKQFFPDNAVEYFVSYYDYYQPEAYVPRSDTYIEKESSVNEQIDRMRHAATRALLERDDVVIVASVSCIYGIGSVETYTAMTFEMKIGDTARPAATARRPRGPAIQAQRCRPSPAARSGCAATRSRFSRPTLKTAPGGFRCWGDEIEAITEFDPLTGQKTGDLKSVKIYANSHYVTPRPTLNQAIKSIKKELKWRLEELNDAGRLLEAQRLEQRTRFDLEMLEATGSCAGIENYSRYLTGRKPGEPPPTLFEYLPDNAIVFVDESHVTIPQIGGMYRGDFRRKATLAEYGFRLPSCMDNRPAAV